MEEKELIILSPFETPDIQLTLKTIYAGSFGVLHLGKNNDEAKVLIEKITRKTQKPFGICLTHSTTIDFTLPENVTKIIVPFGYNLTIKTKAEILYQVHSTQEAEEAIAKRVSSIIIRGQESEKNFSKESSYDIFRNVINNSLKKDIKVYVQANTGVHTSAAFMGLGAHGIIFDSQIALFPESNVKIPENYDIALADDLAERYGKLNKFIFAVYEAAYGHLNQAKQTDIVSFEEEHKSTDSEKKDTEKSSPNLLEWESHINNMLQKEKNLSKFTLVISNNIIDAFFSAFVSIMAAPVKIRGINVRISSPDKSIKDQKYYKKLQVDTRKILAEAKEISPVIPSSNPLNIAVVGIECIYPGAANKDEYWRNILMAKDCISEIPSSHWDKDSLYKEHTRDTDYSFSKW